MSYHKRTWGKLEWYLVADVVGPRQNTQSSNVDVSFNGFRVFYRLTEGFFNKYTSSNLKKAQQPFKANC